MFKSLLREPLVHFLLLGAMLFVLDGWLRPSASAAKSAGEIVVSEARIRNLAQNFGRTWQRPPTREELDGLIEAYIREEVMVREALSLGLDRDDAIIRRRLQQKVEFVSEEGAALARANDDELRAYMAAHPEAFRAEPRVSFAQIYLDPRKRGSAVEEEARRLMEKLNQPGVTTDPGALGDRLLLLEPQYDDLTQTDVARTFGTEFAESIVTQPTGRWVGPLASGYGLHVVKIGAVRAGAMPPLEDVRPLVEREWSNVKRQEISKSFYERLRAKYAITVKMPEAVKP